MGPGESLFSTLVRYTPQHLKSQVENFTTELFAHCLRTIPSFLGGFLDLLKIRTRKLDPRIRAAPPERWTVKTQLPISTSSGLTKYPDLALRHPSDPAFYILVEVKVEAPTTLSLDDDGQYVSQLRIYQRWLEDRARSGRLLVLSKYLPDGLEYCSGHISWRDMNAVLEQLLKSGSKLPEGDRFLAREFSMYLREQHMVPKPISIESIRALRESLNLESDLFSILSQVVGRWQKHFGFSSTKGRSMDGSWKGDYYIYSAALRRGKLTLWPGLWLEADRIFPFFWVSGLGARRAAAVLETLSRVLGPGRAEYWGRPMIVVFGKCPQGLFKAPVEQQEDALFRSGADALRAVFKAIGTRD